jgi:hypothetical protein
MSQHKEGFHSTILQEDLTMVGEEDSIEVEDEVDLVEEVEDQSFVIIEINWDIWKETTQILARCACITEHWTM